MTRMTETSAANLDPAQAAALVRVLDLQAEWQNLKEDGRDHSTARLQGLQRTFEIFRVGLADYTTQYGADQVPELTPTSPERLWAWCRVVQAVVQRAPHVPGTGSADQVMSRAYQTADRIAERLGKDLVARKSGLDTRDGVLAGLKAVSVWCSGLAAPLHSSDNLQSPSYETPTRTSPDESAAA